MAEQEALTARLALLEKEKELTRLSDEVAKQRRALPKVPVPKARDYVFDTRRGPASLTDLFHGRSQLIIYHFMFGPEWEEGCPSCSMWIDALSALTPHLAARDVSLAIVARTSMAKLGDFVARMGWNDLAFASSLRTDFNKDFGVLFDEDADRDAEGRVEYNYKRTTFPMSEAPGLSVFELADNGSVLRTYSAYSRGLESIQPIYGLLDMTPKGRQETGAYKMDWVKLKDKVDPRAPAWGVGGRTGGRPRAG